MLPGPPTSHRSGNTAALCHLQLQQATHLVFNLALPALWHPSLAGDMVPAKMNHLDHIGKAWILLSRPVTRTTVMCEP